MIRLSAPRRAASLVLLAALGLTLSACRRQPDGAGQPTKPPNFLVLVVDALRYDHLGFTGYSRPTTPTLDALAARGYFFDRALSAASYTRPAVPAIFTGAYPSVHGAFGRGDRLSDDFVTLAETLKAAGWATAACAPNPSLHRRHNFGQGFDLYEDGLFNRRERPAWKRFETAKKIEAVMLRWLDSIGDRPYFAYLHYRDVHGPYLPPPPYGRLFWDPEKSPLASGVRRLTAAERLRAPDYLGNGKPWDSLDQMVSQYDGKIRYTDDQLAAFLARLEQRGNLDNTHIFVTADHGEEFLDHGGFVHGSSLYQELVHVPLLYLPPASRSGRRIDALVQTLDLYPTILELAGRLPAPDHIQGASLLPLIAGRSGRSFQFAEGPEEIAVVDRRYKLYVERVAGVEEKRLFDLLDDPREQRDLALELPLELARLEREIDRHRGRNRALAGRYRGSAIEQDAETIEALEALGYLN